MPKFRDHFYTAFLFDMDGTMLDSSIVVERVWRSWGDRHGVDTATLLANVHGVRGEEIVRRFAPAGTNIAEEVTRVQKAEMEDVEGIVPVEGIIELVASLDPALWAVVTSAPRELAKLRLQAVGLPLPRIMVAAEDVARGKPDPEGFLKAAKLLGVPINDCLVFEDSHAGVAAAKAAGAHVAIVGSLVPAEEGMLAIGNYR